MKILVFDNKRNYRGELKNSIILAVLFFYSKVKFWLNRYSIMLIKIQVHNPYENYLMFFNLCPGFLWVHHILIMHLSYDEYTKVEYVFLLEKCNLFFFQCIWQTIAKSIRRMQLIRKVNKITSIKNKLLL